jgi:hypothetical protein
MYWAVSAVIVGSLAMFWLTIRLRAYRAAERGLVSGSEEFSFSRYEPMNRLLREEDLIFLAAQPGYRPEIGKNFRRERRRVFRLYLNELAGDFRRLHAQARGMVAESEEQHAELVGLLMRQQLRFWRSMMAIELRLVMHHAGIGEVDVRGLVDAFESMRVDLIRVSRLQTA